MSLHEFLGEERLLEWFYSANSTNTGQKIGYRRVSGKIGLTNKENGVRGAWVEKRVAFFKNVLGAGMRIVPLSEPTDATRDDGFESFDTYQECDTLVLEFGGTNLQFYQKYWDKTVEMINAHKGNIVFLNDDPDLPFLWELLPNENWSRWTIAANAAVPAEVATILKCPQGSTTIDLPMAAGMEFAEFHAGEIEKVVYIGRPSGRTKHFKEYTKSPYLEVAGKEAEWSDYADLNIVENPQQRDRRAFYQKYHGCLAVYDDKHKRSGWRTGRAYHAVYAGIPVCAPQGNNGLVWCFPADTADSLQKFASLSIEKREKIWLAQKQYILNTDKVTLNFL
jgi:hypothetical protein